MAITLDADAILVRNSERVRDYLIASGSGDANPLAEALAALGSTPPWQADKLESLRRAANDSFEKLEKSTLEAVIEGRLVVGGETSRDNKGGGRFSVQNLAAFIGLILMITSLHFSNWSTRAEGVTQNLVRVNEIGNVVDLEDMVSLRNLCGTNSVSFDQSDVSRYISSSRSFEYYDTIWTRAQVDLQNLNQSFVPFRPQVSAAMKYFSNQGPAKPIMLSQNNRIEDLCKTYNEDSASVVDKFKLYQSSIQDFASAVPMFSGSILLSGRGSASTEILRRELTDKINLIKVWFLPVIHGALGAVIFCLVKGIRQFSVVVTYRELIIRLFFGAFIGFAVSTLLIPAGWLGSDLVAPAPVASLAAFVFGYSIDSFLAILNKVNNYFVALGDSKVSDK